MEKFDQTNSRDTIQAEINLYNMDIRVPFEYPVYFSRGIFQVCDPLLESVLDKGKEKRCHRAAVYIDSGVVDSHPEIILNIQQYFQTRSGRIELAFEPEIIPGGKTAKTNWDNVHRMIEKVDDSHLDRQSFVVAVGGGSVLDMVGFAASIIHRGLRLVRIPTTTLAQADSGIGIKNGLDVRNTKNLIGTFTPPFAVINDFDFLGTLDFEHWIGGVAEAFKVAIIKDADFFEYLCQNTEALSQRDASVIETVIHRCAVLHLEHIRNSRDPFEFGSERPLDFGHWAAHKLETLSDYSIGHSQAVALGVAVDSAYSLKEGLISQSQFEMIISGLNNCGLKTWNESLEQRTDDGQLVILDGLRQFREHLGGELTITLPKGLGSKTEVNHMDTETIEQAVSLLKDHYTKGSTQ